jgi:C4-dicarboxylate transporter DctQ subunit
VKQEQTSENVFFSSFLNVLIRFSEYITTICLVIAGLSIFIQVILRYIFKIGFPWTEELARYLVIYLSLIGSSIVVKNKDHPRIDLIYELFPEKVKAFLAFLFNILNLIFLIVLFWQGIDNTRFGLDTRTPALQILWAWPYASIPLGAGLMILQLLPDLIETTKNVRR